MIRFNLQPHGRITHAKVIDKDGMVHEVMRIGRSQEWISKGNAPKPATPRDEAWALQAYLYREGGDLETALIVDSMWLVPGKAIGTVDIMDGQHIRRATPSEIGCALLCISC
jgi:hypothetical protein